MSWLQKLIKIFLPDHSLRHSQLWSLFYFFAVRENILLLYIFGFKTRFIKTCIKYHCVVRKLTISYQAKLLIQAYSTETHFDLNNGD